MKRFLMFLFHLFMVILGAASAFMCLAMTVQRPVALPGLWITGLLLFLIYVTVLVSRMDRSERYTMEEFERKWIVDRNRKKGFRYHDRPGCYVIRIYRHRPILPVTAGFRSIYVGQSMEVYRRIHSHLNRKGNGDVYADARDGNWIEIDVYPCSPAKLNRLEIRLIRRYHAEDSYNRTAGGGTRRSFFRS